ncbi:hypothetical protein BM1_08861 [Bipolaris maydis]|nr:hypothetical protein BM1_08861 [Bipolaris maydis]
MSNGRLICVFGPGKVDLTSTGSAKAAKAVKAAVESRCIQPMLRLRGKIDQMAGDPKRLLTATSSLRTTTMTRNAHHTAQIFHPNGPTRASETA